MVIQTNILKDLKKHLVQNLGNLIVDVILFGSQAKGESNESSDYDVLIILSKNITSHLYCKSGSRIECRFQRNEYRFKG
jgi:predicted nucleotidyltransferase